MKTITIVNHKGGVAKTDTANNLGHALAMDGHKVLLVDADPQGNLSYANGVDSPDLDLAYFIDTYDKEAIHKLNDNISIIPSSLGLQRFELDLSSKGINGFTKIKNALQILKNEYDYCIIDCAPSIGYLVSNAIIASDKVIIPVVPEADAYNAIRNVLEIIEDSKQLNKDVEFTGIVFTKVRNINVHKHAIEELKKMFDGKVFKTQFSELVEMTEARMCQKTIFEYKPNSNSALSFESLKYEIV